jgi:hypothetical protein
MIYISLGIPSSASTWVYNILKAVLKKRQIFFDSYLCETLGDMMKHDASPARAHVWKAHNLQPPLLQLISLSDVPFVISVRDPRDAVASLVGRFNAHPIDSAQQVMRSIASVFSAVGACPGALVFEYETGFPEKLETVRAIAGLMRLDLSDAELEDIRAEFSIDRVRDFTSRLEALPEDQLVRNGDDVMDADTHFHRVHVSDGAVGKWRNIIPADLHGDFNALFDPVAGIAFYERGMTLDFPTRMFRGGSHSESLPRSEYRNPGFCLLEHIYLGRGKWTVEVTCTGRNGLAGARLVRILQAGGSVHDHRLDPAAEAASFSFDFTSRRNDTAIEAFLVYPDEPRFYGDDAVPVATLRATYKGPL